jgi:nicotinamide riboside kinase
MTTPGKFTHTCACGEFRSFETEKQRTLFQKLHGKTCEKASKITVNVIDQNVYDGKTKDTLKITTTAIKQQQQEVDKFLRALYA